MSDLLAENFRMPLPRLGWVPWLVCLSAGLFFLYEFFQLNLFDVINQPLRDEFNLDAAQLSLMSSSYVWANVLFLLPAGVMLDRFSTRQVILLAMTSCVLGTLGFALSTSFIWAATFHALTGVGNAFCFLSCVVLISRWFPPRRQALVIGCVVTMAFIGGMIAHTPFGLLSHVYGWRYALFVDVAVGLVILGWIFFTVKNHPDIGVSKTTQAVKPVVIPNFWPALVNRQNWLAGLYTACLNLPIMVLCALWGASYLQDVHQLTGLAASNVVSLIFAGSILGCPLVGWLSDSYGRRKPFMLGGAILTLIIVTILCMGITLSQTILSVLFFTLGLVTSTQVIAYPLIAESNSLHITGVATGMASVIIMGGGGVGQVLFGFLMRQHAGFMTTHYTTAHYQFAMWMFPVATAIALVSVLLIRETYGKAMAEAE